MCLQKYWAILLGKIIFRLSRVFQIGGGMTAPGYYALKIDPNLVSELSQDIPQTIVITGTNGKTTTSRLLAHFARMQGLRVIHNSTGSNLERGITSTLISSSHIGGGKVNNVDLAIWELDEAAFNTVVPKIKPTLIIFLNAFRDQLDRYGEVDTIINRWSNTLKQVSPDAKVIINGDDANLLDLKKKFKGVVLDYGVKDSKIRGEKFTHQVTTKQPDFEALEIKTEGLEETSFDVLYQEQRFGVTLPLPGLYNVYNFLAAFACSQALGWSLGALDQALEDFSPAFGRVEKINLQGKDGYIFLIKNPAGATQVFQTLQGEIKEGDRLLLALNDNLADGTDVSWIWDGKFELLRTTNHEPTTVCSGTRAEDLAMRLKYAGFEPDNLVIEKNLKNALEQATKGLEGRLFILPTYTALLSLQHILTSHGIKSHYWKEKN